MPKKNEEDVKKDQDNSNKKVKKKKSRKIKKSTIKKISAVVVLIAILAVVLYFAFKTLKPEKTLAEVNGEIITKQQLERQYSQLPDQYRLFITEEAFLDQMINVKLLLQEAKKQAIVVSEEEIEEELNNIKEQAPTEEAFQQLLEQSNIELSQFKKQLNEQLTINKLLDETVISKIEITESKVKDYYNNNKDFFEQEEISYNKAKEQIKQILLDDISNNAIEIYISQLRAGAVITKEGVKITKEIPEIEEIEEEIKGEIETFTKTGDDICKEDNKVIIRLFSTTKNSASNWISQAFDQVANEYSNDIIAYHWQLDTGDNTLTDIEEKGIPRSEVEIFQKYSPKNAIPAYVFGCKYVRIKNAYDTLDQEKEEFRRVIERLLSP